MVQKGINCVKNDSFFGGGQWCVESNHSTVLATIFRDSRIKITNQSELHYLFLFVEKICLQIFAPRCSTAKPHGMLDSIVGFLKRRPNIQVTDQARHSFSVKKRKQLKWSKSKYTILIFEGFC